MKVIWSLSVLRLFPLGTDILTLSLRCLLCYFPFCVFPQAGSVSPGLQALHAPTYLEATLLPWRGAGRGAGRGGRGAGGERGGERGGRGLSMRLRGTEPGASREAALQCPPCSQHRRTTHAQSKSPANVARAQQRDAALSQGRAARSPGDTSPPAADPRSASSLPFAPSRSSTLHTCF